MEKVNSEDELIKNQLRLIKKVKKSLEESYNKIDINLASHRTTTRSTKDSEGKKTTRDKELQNIQMLNDLEVDQ